MTFNKSLMTATLLTIGGFAAMSSANAATELTSRDFGVSMEVEAICTFDAAPTAVVLDPIQGGQATAAVTTTTAIIVNCSKGNSAMIGLQPKSTPASANGTGNLLLDGLEAATEKVAYKLTSVSADGAAWGTTTPVSSAPADSFADAVSTTVYVTVADTADVVPGSYSDVVTVSVSY